MLTLRRFRDEDLPAVLALHVDALKPTGAYLGTGPWDDDLRHIQETYFDDNGEFLVGEEDDRLIAMGAFWRTDAQRAEIKRMRVHPDYQGRGYGRNLLQALEERARALGYVTLHLETSTLQLTAQSLYRRYGFVETHRKLIHGLECTFMEKAIA